MNSPEAAEGKKFPKRS